METKNPDRFVISKTEQLLFENHLLIPPTGHGAGGLALLWKKEINLQILSSNANHIDTVIVFEGKEFHSSFIYGNTDKKIRKEFWDKLITLAEPREAPWFITGDFNDLTSNSEKTGGAERSEGSFTDLRTFLSEGDLYDLQHSGDPLSWRGKRGDDIVRCRLDRAVANSLWAEIFPTARTQYMAYEGSDHKPIVSFFEPEKKKRRGLFRYDRRLKDNDEAKTLVAETWKNATHMCISDRISRVRSAIAEWSRAKYSNNRILIEEKKAQLESALTCSTEDATLIKKISDELNSAYLAEEEHWRQRSRILWLTLGDRNSGYFHAVSRNRKRVNAFSVIEDADGTMVYEEEQISKVIVNHFQ